MACDHRVLDGAPAARALAALEEVLHGVICTELDEIAEETVDAGYYQRTDDFYVLQTTG